jgi:hypothetical protein
LVVGERDARDRIGHGVRGVIPRDSKRVIGGCNTWWIVGFGPVCEAVRARVEVGDAASLGALAGTVERHAGHRRYGGCRHPRKWCSLGLLDASCPGWGRWRVYRGFGWNMVRYWWDRVRSWLCRGRWWGRLRHRCIGHKLERWWWLGIRSWVGFGWWK